ARWFVDRLPHGGIPSVSLRRLLPDAKFVGCPDWEVSGCSDDHRRLDPGQLFVATRGPHYDGHAFIREAFDRGAAGVVLEQPCPEAGRLQVVVDDARAAHARICQALAGDPSRRISMLGVAGDVGKTVTSLFVRSILEAAGLRCGLVGALGWSDGLATRPLGAGLGTEKRAGSSPRSRLIGASATSSTIGGPRGDWPGGAAGLASILAYMVDQSCQAGVIEVASEAIEARSFEGVAFQAAVVTDLGVPYGLPTEVALRHRRASAKLFRQIEPGGAAVVNADDPHAEILGGVNLDARRVSFGLEDPTSVDVSARIQRMDSSGSRFLLGGFDRLATVNLRLIGPRQITHALAAAALAWALEIDLGAVVAGLEGLTSVSGCLEAVNEGQDFDVRIDAAATAPALRQAITALRTISAGRIHLVVSGEGGQETSVRRELAEAAEHGADRIILTLGSPRTEAPDQIVDDLLGGFHRPDRVCAEPDRARAIAAAIAGARPGDAVLIAGKGRNNYQIFADRVVPFDDFQVARACLRARRKAATLRKEWSA
ncbi:MAG: Mur ligase family protein, partial [Isosphaeraceae bacterium]